MAVIELGLLSPDGDEPHRAPDRRPFRRPDLRRVLVALVAAGTLLTVTGSTRPEPHGLTQLWSAPLRQDTDSFRLVGDSVFVINQDPGPRLTAHDARTGAVRWSTAEVEERAWLETLGADVVLLPAGFTTVKQREPDGAESSREINRETVALDTATGRQLWRQRGEVTATLGDRVLLSEWNETGERARLLRVVRLHDGAAVWSHTSGEAEFWTTDTTTTSRAADRLVTVTPQGAVRVVALTDGTVLATGRIPWTSQSQNDDYTAVTVQGHRLYVDQTRQGKATVSAYDTETMRPLWRIAQPSGGGSYGCGPVLCLPAGNGIAGHDRDTGQRRWRLTGAVNVYPHLDGRLMVDEESGGHSLIDGSTGRRLADLGGAMPVWTAVGGSTAYLVGRTTQPADRTSVARLDPATVEVLLRGTIDPISDYGCQNSGTLLACHTRDNRLIVTDVG